MEEWRYGGDLICEKKSLTFPHWRSSIPATFQTEWWSDTFIDTSRRIGGAPMIISFHDRGTDYIFNGIDSKVARRTCPAAIWSVARRKLNQINQAVTLDDLRAPSSNHLEALRRDRLGVHSIRINEQYRVCFRWTPTGATEVEVADYH